MENLPLIIKGAVYFDGDTILVPHSTGQYWMVDCTQYLPRKEIISRWGNKFFKENKGDYKEYQGVKYYYAEWGPFHTENFELLSDLSQLFHTDEEYSFE